jgi:hypothetical protein
MAATEEVILYKLETGYLPSGFDTGLGRIIPFYGRDQSYVAVPEGGWLTPAEARHVAAALVTLADAVETVSRRTGRYGRDAR